MRVMVPSFLICGLLAVAPALAQEIPASAPVSPPSIERTCWPAAPTTVNIELRDGSRRRGSLLCLGPDALTVSGKSFVERIALDDVRAVKRPPDSLLDGTLKGAAVGALLMGICAGSCPMEYVLRSTAGYALIGAAIDAIDTHAETLYAPSGHPGVRMGIRVPLGGRR